MSKNINVYIQLQCPHCKRWFVICGNCQNSTPREIAKLKEYCPYCSKRKNKKNI